MKIARFEHEGAIGLGIVEGEEIIDVSAAVAHVPFGGLSAEQVLAVSPEALRSARDRGRRLALAQLHLLAPTQPSKIIAVGLNYRQHIAEAAMKVPADPVLFAKFPSSVSGPYDPIVIPRENPNVDWEAELGVVIGRRGKRISEERAQEFIAGYVALNDVSARVWQFQDRQWTRGKSCDTFSPFGPCLVTAEDVGDVGNLSVVARVNGKVMQRDTTANMIFEIPRLIEFISAAITLEPGDVIATGTPDGVGVFRKPPVFLRPGDVVEVEIGAVGTLRNPVVAEAEA